MLPKLPNQVFTDLFKSFLCSLLKSLEAGCNALLGDCSLESELKQHLGGGRTDAVWALCADVSSLPEQLSPLRTL